MKHSSNQSDREQEYARMNNDYLEGKRELIKSLKKDDKAERKDKSITRIRKQQKFCCWVIIIIAIVCGYVSYYFVKSIRQPVVETFIEKKQELKQLIPEGKKELDKSLEQGEELLNETKDTIEKTQETYEKAKQTVETAQDFYENVKEANEQVQGVVDGIKKELE
jgi:uncharacterized protein HemX